MTTTLFDPYYWRRYLGLDIFQKPIRQPEIACELSKLTWKKAVFTTPLSIDVSGEWSPRQAFRVTEALRSEAEEMGLMLVPVNVTTHGGPARVLILVLCRRHDVPVSLNTVCPKCKMEFPV